LRTGCDVFHWLKDESTIYEVFIFRNVRDILFLHSKTD